MADRDLQAILNSGELTNMFIGGTASDNTVVVFSDLAGLNIDFDNSSTSLSATNTQAALAELANVGFAHMQLQTPYTGGQTLTLTPAKISAFDAIHHDVNGAVTPLVDTSEAVHTHKFTIDKTGTYRIYGTIIADFASADAVSLQLYKNGVATGSAVQIQGRGASKPVLFSYIDIVDLTALDYLEIWGFSDAASTSTLITGASMIVERMPL